LTVSEPGANRNSRKLVADAATAEFAEHGYAGARTERIAKQAGVNKQLLFYYFGSKAGLYRGILDAAAEELRAAVTSGTSIEFSATESLRSRLKAVFEALAGSPHLARLVVRGAFDADSEAADRPIREITTELARVISRGQGLGYFRDDVDPTVAARQAAVLLVGYLALEEALTESPAEPGRADWISSVSDLLVRSLSW
jgi:AcrR family transcriptional regulator